MKKRIQAIWQAGIEDFSARRARAVTMRSALPQEAATEEQVQRAVLAATAALRNQVESLQHEVAGLKARLGKGKKK